METSPKNNNPSRKKWLSTYARFSGLAFQMIAVILLFSWLGHKMDGWFNASGPWFTTTGALLSLCIALYWLFSSVPKK